MRDIESDVQSANQQMRSLSGPLFFFNFGEKCVFLICFFGLETVLFTAPLAPVKMQTLTHTLLRESIRREKVNKSGWKTLGDEFIAGRKHRFT